MANSAFDLLLPFLQGESLHGDNEPCLLIADENLAGIDFGGLDKATQIISNRFDIAQLATMAGLPTQFNDFDFSAYPAGHFARICYRLSKEKAVVEHIIDKALYLLREGGELILCGAKNEGIKRYGAVAAERFDCPANTRKHGAFYIARIIKRATVSEAAMSAEVLAATSGFTSSYTELLPVAIDDETTLYTKAGAFGSAKIDQGSGMLASYLKTFFESFQTRPRSLLDLGCGYGYLSLCASRFGIEHLVATDNCAAAIDVCQANMTRLDVPVKVIADDCARGIAESFDVVLCNPPFHLGFKTDATLTEKFVRSAARRLNTRGKALFVVNQFVPLEKIADRLFREVIVVERDRSFKLVSMSGVLTGAR